MSASGRVLMDGLVRAEMLRSGIAMVRLNRPKKYNGLSIPMFRAIERAALTIAETEDVKAVVLAGEGKVFCAGLDVNSMIGMDFQQSIDTLLKREADRVDNLAQAVGYLWRDRVDVPVISAIHGVCFGGGFQIAMGADARFATSDTRFSIMEAKWGLIPDMSASVTLRECVSMPVATRLTWTGEIFNGERALAYGLCDELCADPVSRAIDYIEGLQLRTPDEAREYKATLLETRKNKYRCGSWKLSPRVPAAPSERQLRDIMSREGSSVVVRLASESASIALVPELCASVAGDASVRAVLLKIDDAPDKDVLPAKLDVVADALESLRRLPVPVLAVLTPSNRKETSVLTSSALVASLGADLRFTVDSADVSWRAPVEDGSATSSMDVIFSRLGEIVGSDRAAKMMGTDRKQDMTADVAHKIGLLDVCTSDPIESALSFARLLERKNTDAVVSAKELFVTTWHADEASALKKESDLQRDILPSYNMIGCSLQNFLPKWAPRLPPKGRMKTRLIEASL
eukprot:g2284.t1